MCAICERSQKLGKEAADRACIQLGELAHQLHGQGVDPEQFLLAVKKRVGEFVDGFEAWCREAGEPRCPGERFQA